jgi:homoserine kinase type II
MRYISAILGEYPAEFRPRRVESLGMAGGMSGAEFWRIDAPAGTLALRRWPHEHPTPERLRFIHGVLDHAAARGVTFVAAPIRTTRGESFIDRGGELWELARWMPGAADYERSPSHEKLLAAIKSLALFHQATSDFPIAATLRVARAPAIGRHLTRLTELLSGGVQSLSQAISNYTWPELVPLARRFLERLPHHLPRAIRRLEPFENVSFNLQPVLRDIWHDHVLFTGNDVTGIIDYGAVDIDTPVTDIARLLGSLAGDDESGFRVGLAAYVEVRPLAGYEQHAVAALDASGTILAGCNWLRWIYVERREFPNRAQVVERFRRIVARCENAAASIETPHTGRSPQGEQGP